jgi:polyisoprenoid-binding protein YceI
MLKKIAIGIVVLAVLGGAVLFVLDRTIFAPVAVSTDAPVAPTLSAPVVAATSAPATDSTVQAYSIDPAQSEVSYEVNETIFDGNRLNTAIGRTKGVAGDIRIDFNQPANSQIGTIVIDVSQFKSDEDRRDNFIRRQGLESATYPTATFTTQAISGLPAQVQLGQPINFTISGDLTVKTTTKPVTWNVTLTADKDKITGTATAQILMSDFGVGPIQVPILATEDQVKLTFDFVAVPAQG